MLLSHRWIDEEKDDGWVGKNVSMVGWTDSAVSPCDVTIISFWRASDGQYYA